MAQMHNKPEEKAGSDLDTENENDFSCVFSGDEGEQPMQRLELQ